MLGRVITRARSHSSLRTNSRGDTIIEVLVSIAVLSLALGICYSLANKSLRTGISATNRAEASAINQGQVELLKNARAQLTATQFNNTFTTPSSYFCFSSNAVSSYRSTSCTSPSGLYNTRATYNSGTDVFTINTSWDSLSGSGQDQLTIYYKVQQ